MKEVFLLLSVCFSLSLLADGLNFLAKPLSAGKALLAENGFQVTRSLGTANFSPEIRLPVQLIYNSAREKSGLFGYAWYSPQLESTAHYDKDGVLWTTPWGEKIKFFPKKEKLPKDAIKIPLYEEAKKGRGFFAPYSEWECDTSKRDFQKSGDWVFKGLKSKKGWRLEYKDYKLVGITAPSGRSLSFEYQKNCLRTVSQNGVPFIEIVNSGSVISSLKINGIERKFSYASTPLVILPKTPAGNASNARRACLKSLRHGKLLPVEFSYDSNGYLDRIKQGDFVENLQVQHQTAAQKKSELAARKNSKLRYTGPVAGRIVADGALQYTYPSFKSGSVKLTNKAKQTASYDFYDKTGVFRITEFSGKSYTIYYFMRHDVAYLGKVRKVVDSRGRDVMNCRYDKFSGNVIRLRDMVGNDINFDYYENGKVRFISKRGADESSPVGVTAFRYDGRGNVASVSQLDRNGRAVVTTRFLYDFYNMPTMAENGQRKEEISYNPFGYPVSLKNNFGQVITGSYDRYNTLTAVTDIWGITTYFTANESGLVTAIVRKDGEKVLNSLAIEYNGNGHPISYTDQSQRVKRFERDALGRVVKELFPDDTSVEYAYNAVGQLHQVYDQNRHVITFDWSRFGLEARRTPAGQLTDFVHDKYGLLIRTDSKWQGKIDKSVKFEYDKYDRPIKVTYGPGEVETRKFDTWGKLVAATRGKRTLTLKYDFAGRIVEKNDTGTRSVSTYNPWGQRTSFEVTKGNFRSREERVYDRYGRLVKIISGDKTVEFIYNSQNQLARQIINGKRIDFEYTRYGQLKRKIMLD